MALPVHTKGISLTLKMMELTGYKSKTELHNLLSGLYYLDRLAKRLLNLFLKFGLLEKHTKFERNLPRGFDKSADLLSKRQNHEEAFFKKSEL